MMTSLFKITFYFANILKYQVKYLKYFNMFVYAYILNELNT